MQNPKKALDKGEWYRILGSVTMTMKHNPGSRGIKSLDKNSMVLFLGYHPSSVRHCHVMSGELIGWVEVPGRFKAHQGFFSKVVR